MVEAARGGGSLVRLPDNAVDVFGTRARFPVRATFNGVPYRGSTMPTGDGRFCIGITKTILAQAGIHAGDRVDVTIERDDGEREVELPDELAAALHRSAILEARFERLSYTARKEYAAAVAGAKKPETRERRIERIIEELSGP